MTWSLTVSEFVHFYMWSFCKTVFLWLLLNTAK